MPRTGERDPTSLQQAYDLVVALRHAEAAYNSLIVAATRQQDHATLSVAFRRRAVVAHQSGDAARARSGLQQSYAVATMLGDRRLTAETLNTLGGLELETRNLEAAETALLEAEALASADPIILARVEQNLGIVSNIRGDLEVAETHYRRSLAAYEALPDPHGSAIAHHNLGMLAADRGDNTTASQHFTICEDLAEASRDSHLVALCLVNHAEVLVGLGRTDKARESAEAAERILQGMGVHFDEGDVHRVLALCDRAEGQLQQAEARLVQARELSRYTGARLTEAEVQRELGRLYADTGRVVDGVALLHEAAQAFAGLGARGEAKATEQEAGRLEAGAAMH